MKVELIVDNHSSLGEGPVWDHRTNTLYWVDIERCLLYAYDYAGGHNRSFQMGEYTGAAVPTTSGRLVVALQNRIIWYDPRTSQSEALCEPEPGLRSNRFNDGKCDPKGRFWIGSTQVDHKDPSGVLYCVDQKGTFTPKLEGLLVSNGLAWSADGTSLYFIDSPRHTVQQFDFDLDSGNIEFRGEALTFGEDRIPDGMAIDNNGNLWIAFYGAGTVACFDVSSKKELISIPVPAKNTTSCCFGGPDMDELFITTAKRDDPQGGGLYLCKPGVTGPRANFFGDQ